MWRRLDCNSVWIALILIIMLKLPACHKAATVLLYFIALLILLKR